MLENRTPETELPRRFCAGIGPLELGVVLVTFLVCLGVVVFYISFIPTISQIYITCMINKHNAELQSADPSTKVSGPYFPTQCPNWICIIPIVVVEKKKTLN